MALTRVGVSLSAYNGSLPATAVLLSPSPTAGNALIAVVRWTGAVTISSIADTLGNTWVQIGSQFTAQSFNVAAFYAQANLISATDTVTVTWSSSPTLDGLMVIEYSGQGAAILDSFINASGASGNPFLFPSYPASYTNETIITVGSTNGLTAISAPTLGTLVENGIANDLFLIEDTETASLNYSYGATNTQSWSGFTIGLRSTTSTLGVNPLFIQQGTQSSTTGSAPPLAYPTNNRLGSFLCIGGRGAITAVTDSQGNTWTQSPTNSNFWYVLSSKAGANSVTYTNTQNEVWIAEFSNISARQTSGIVSPASGTGTALSVGPITPAVNECLVIAFCSNSTSNSMNWTPGTGFTLIQNVVGQRNAMGEWLVQTTAAALTPALTSSISIAWTMGAEIFSPAAFSISGSCGIIGATISYAGPLSGSVTSTSGGAYTIPSLPNGAYTITPSLTNYTFSPTSSNQTLAGSNISGVNFTSTQTLVATPTFSPIAGTYTGLQNIVMSTTTPAATIYYTTDGSTPTTGSTLYTGPVAVATTLTLKAIAAASGFANSAVASAAYTINAVSRSTRSK